MKKMILTAIAASVLWLPVALAQMPEPAKVGETAKGKALVDSKGMTLYILDRDTVAGKSTCNGQCATLNDQRSRSIQIRISRRDLNRGPILQPPSLLCH